MKATETVVMEFLGISKGTQFGTTASKVPLTVNE